MKFFNGIVILTASMLASYCGNQVPDRDRQILVSEARLGADASGDTDSTEPENKSKEADSSNKGSETITPVSTTPAPGKKAEESEGGGAMLTCADSFTENLAADLAGCASAGCHGGGVAGVTFVADEDMDNLQTIKDGGFPKFIAKVGPNANPTHRSFSALEAKFETVEGDCE